MKFRNVCLALLLMSVAFLFAACKNWHKGLGRDADAEYAALLEATYDDLDTACSVTSDYLDYFSQRFRNDEHCDDVRRIQLKFEEIRSTVYNEDGSFADFVNETTDFGEKIAQSPYPVVRNTWKAVFVPEYTKRKKEFLAIAIPDDMFDHPMLRSAEDICGGDYPTWRVTQTEEVKIEKVTICSDELAKEAVGAFRVHLRWPFGLRSGTVTVRITGRIISDTEGRTSYRMIDHTYLETSGDVPMK